MQDDVHKLLFKAEYCQSRTEKLALYEKAVDKCKEYGFSEREAEVHCKMANLNLLTTADPCIALANADNAIQAHPTSDVSLLPL